MKSLTALFLAFALTTAAAFAQTPATPKPKPRVHKKSGPTEVEKQVQALSDLVNAQREQLQTQSQQMDQLKSQMQQLLEATQQANAAAATAQGQAEAAAAQTAQQQQAVAVLHNDVSDLRQASASTALAVQDTQKSISSLESPLAIHYKGITITPGGFLSGDGVWRRTALGADISTPLNSIPYGGSSATNLSEFFASGRASRVSMLSEGSLGSAKLTGYVEADFLSSGITSNSNSTNSYTLRLRQGFAQAVLNNGWSFTGGQTWTLITETRNGVDNRSELPPMTIDTSYNAGFSNPRQFGFRVAKDFGNKFWLAFSAENAQTTLTAHGNSQNFLVGAAGTSSGAYNPSATYSYNELPDFIAKAVYQPGALHLEVFGLVSTFRDRVFPNATATPATAAGAYNDTSVGKGIGANARVSLANKHLDLALHFFGGTGIGRYGTASLADVTVRPDGVLVPIRNYQTLGTIEYRSKRLDLYGYVGGEYDARTAFVSGGKGEGYGSTLFSNVGCSTEIVPGTPVGGQFPTSTSGFLPGALANCTGDTRSLLEGTVGFWYRFTKGPRAPSSGDRSFPMWIETHGPAWGQAHPTQSSP
jgi:hypothetical protein